MAQRVKLEIMTPRELLYRDEVDSVSVKTVSGSEGFMAGHTWALKLLPEQGGVTIRNGKNTRKARLRGGCLYVRDDIIILCDEAEWVS